MNTSFIIERPRHHWSRSLSIAVAALFLMSVIMANTNVLHALTTIRTTNQPPLAMNFTNIGLVEPSVGNTVGIMADTVDPTKYFFVFDDDGYFSDNHPGISAITTHLS